MTRGGGRPVTEVAVGVMLRDDGRVLLADRPAGKAYAGYWEFPGGKVEDGESVEQALARELHEELGLRIGPVQRWLVREHDYPHAYVRLHFCRVRAWSGQPVPHEGQRLGFFEAPALRPRQPAWRGPGPLLPAAVAVMPWLALPDRGLWVDPAQLDAAGWSRVAEALASGPTLLVAELAPSAGAGLPEPAVRLADCAALALCFERSADGGDVLPPGGAGGTAAGEGPLASGWAGRVFDARQAVGAPQRGAPADWCGVLCAAASLQPFAWERVDLAILAGGPPPAGGLPVPSYAFDDRADAPRGIRWLVPATGAAVAPA